MRVLLVNAKPFFVDALAASGRVDVAAVYPRENTGSHSASGVPRILYSGGRKISPRAAWQLRNIIQTWRPEVVHAFYGRALAHAIVATTGLSRGPRLVSFRGITSRLSLRNPGDMLSYRHRRVDAHACESAAVRQALIDSNVAAARCHVVYNSIARGGIVQRHRAGLQRFGIPENAFVVGMVGTFRRVKGADIFLRAAIACAHQIDAYWLLIGRVVDPDVARLADHPRIRQRVRLVGYQQNAAELIGGADLFVMPSRSEALCQALLEAMSQGVCPVVSNAGGMKEAVRHNQDGIVVPTSDVSALAGAICALSQDKERRQRLAQSVRARFHSHFTPSQMAQRALSIYEALFQDSQARCAA
jgi:glycosyltransferase involved in cell wall biosynthesis